MSGWLGKIVGGSLGLFFGGFLGGVVGASLGHFIIDRREEQAQKYNQNQEMDAESAQLLYFTLLFSLLAKVAGADGRISRDEGEHLLRYLDRLALSPEQRRLAIDIFNKAKGRSETARDYAAKFYRLQGGRTEVVRTLFEQLVQMATIDGWDANKKRTLDEVAGVFRLHPLFLLFVYQRYGMLFDESAFHSSFQQSQRREASARRVTDPYSVLGVSPSASDAELRKVYRKLARETHPDLLLSQGVPPEFRKNAEERFKEVQEAWEHIRKERKLN